MLKPSDDAPENNFWSAIGGLMNLLVPPAHALNTINDDLQVNGYLYVVGSGGYLNYNDTTSDLYLNGGSYYLLDNTPKFFVYDESTTDYNWYFDFNDASFKLVDTVGANVNNAISITAQSGTTNSNNSFVVDTLGDIGLADNAVFIDRSSDEVGIGTLSPAGSLHILDDALPELILEDGASLAPPPGAPRSMAVRTARRTSCGVPPIRTSSRIPPQKTRRSPCRSGVRR